MSKSFEESLRAEARKWLTAYPTLSEKRLFDLMLNLMLDLAESSDSSEDRWDRELNRVCQLEAQRLAHPFQMYATYRDSRGRVYECTGRTFEPPYRVTLTRIGDLDDQQYIQVDESGGELPDGWTKSAHLWVPNWTRDTGKRQVCVQCGAWESFDTPVLFEQPCLIA